jgi:recombination protein RecA
VNPKELAKELGSVLLEDIAVDIPRMSTGSETLDALLGGGVPVGRITEVIGDFSAGKSLLGLQLCRANGKSGGISILIDSENSLDRKWVESLGVDPKTLIIPNPDEVATLEDTYTYIRKVLEIASDSEQYFLIVWDSIAATPPKAVRNGEGSTMAVDARINSQELRTLLDDLSCTETTLVLINQLRSKPGVLFGQKWESFGGRAIRFYATMRLLLTKCKKIGAKDNVKGFKVKFEVIKTKLGRPFVSTECDLYFDKGIL